MLAEQISVDCVVTATAHKTKLTVCTVQPMMWFTYVHTLSFRRLNLVEHNSDLTLQGKHYYTNSCNNVTQTKRTCNIIIDYEIECDHCLYMYM